MEQAYKEIAPRLAGLREAMGMSPEEMAKKVDVPASTVLLYEEGNTEIPVSYLYSIAQTCDVDLTVLISGTEARLSNYSMVKKGEGLAVERRKDYDYKNLAYRFTGRRMEPFLIRVPARDESTMHCVSHPGQEFIYMLQGRLEVSLDGNPMILEPGDSFYFSSHTPHALRALDGKDAEFLDVII